MADKYTSLFPVDASFVEGEQPTSTKFTGITSLLKASINELERIIGSTRNSISSGVTGNSNWVSFPKKDSFVSDVSDETLNSASHIVSIARAIGPMGALNPRYISNQDWFKSEVSGLGISLVPGVTVQQLPFLPYDIDNILPGDFSGPGATFAFDIKAATYQESLYPGSYYVSREGVLYTGVPVPVGTRLKYSFSIKQGDSYMGAGYNVIPDPSILTFSFSERESKTSEADEYGACSVTVFSSDTDSLVIDIKLPEVISTPYSKLSETYEVEDSDPVGKRDTGGIRRYILPNLYPNSGLIEDNTLYLFNNSSGSVIPEARFERLSEFVVRAYLPSRYAVKLKTDTGTNLDEPLKKNTKDFFLICNGTQLATTVGKLKLEMEEHSHNGLDSVRISHRDLAEVNHITPSYVAQLIAYSNKNGTLPERGVNLPGLILNKTKWLNRKFSAGPFEENPHPYYFHRLGYMGGGTDGVYASQNYPHDLAASRGNGIAGDLVLMPVSKDGTYASNDNAGYSWESTDPIDHTKNNSASHSLWFGLPWVGTVNDWSVARAGRARNGSVRMYFDPWIRVMGYTSGESLLSEPFGTEGLSVLNTGTIGPDVFSNAVFENAIKGLNIQRGNFFFGFNENKFLSDNELAKGKSSFNILASEFNAVVTANKQATNSPDSRWKGKSGNRAGFAVKAIEGSSFNFSVGGLLGTPGNPVPASSLTSRSILGVDYSTAGSFSIESAFGNQLVSSIPGKAHGSGLLASPGTGNKRLFAWQINNLEDIEEPGYYAGWKRWQEVNKNHFASNPQNIGGVNHVFSLLDSDAVNILLSFSKSSLADLTESVKNKNSFPFGKLILEGSSGIDLVVSRGSYNPTIQNVLDLSEIRSWAREDLKADLELDIRKNHAVGANHNLLYGYGRAYARFGATLPWLGKDLDIKGSKQSNPTSLVGGINPWTSLRSEAYDLIGSKDASGSQVRQASFIEAMEGFRSDPNQPFTVTYRIPFRVAQKLTWLTEGYTTPHGVEVAGWEDFGGAVGATGGAGMVRTVFIPSAIVGTFPMAKERVITDDIENYSEILGYTVNPAIRTSTWVSQPTLDVGRFEFGETSENFIDDLGYGVFIDQIIRYYDFQDWARSGYEGNFSPGRSLVDFSVDLNYSKLVYGDSASDNYGKQVPYNQNADLDDFVIENEDAINSYISGKHYSVIRGVDLANPSRDPGIAIRSMGSSSGLASSTALDGSTSWAMSATQEPFKASLMLGAIKLNEDDEYKGSDSIGYEQWLTYLDNIKSNVDPDVELLRPQYNGEEDGSGTLNAPQLAWFLQLEGEPKREDYSLHRFAPYELFMTANGKEHGLGPDQGLVLAFDGYVNLTFKTLGGQPVPRSGVVNQ